MVDEIPNFSILHAEDMHIVKGRKYEADSLWTSANLSKVDLQGGNEQNYDSIFIDDDTMAYNLTVNVASHTKIQNNAVNVPDVFIYKSKYSNSKSYIIDLRMLYSKLDNVEVRLDISSLGSIFIVHVNIVTFMNMEFGLCRIFFKDFTAESLKTQVLVIGNVRMKILESNLKLILLAVPLKFTKNETKIILTHYDIDYNQEIFIDRFLAKYSIFYSNATNLVITDRFNRPVDDKFSSILILKDFYIFYKMRTVIIKFTNQVIKFNDKARFMKTNLKRQWKCQRMDNDGNAQENTK
uniref:Uncharacterized protein n=1 Tax=Romanomermis culicivorax TaxID=13658 RepID=A0A915JR20_ROMCU